MMMLKVEQLRKTFGSVTAVEDISFAVEPGEIFTIIGPNGAGKTTTLEMIEGLQSPDRGTIELNGLTWKKNGADIKRIIGVQPQTSALFDLLTVFETLELFASFYPKSLEIANILELINLTEHQNKNVRSLSGGQKQRLAIGLAMINDPEILFLDEPTTGLDPQARRNIWDIVLKLKQLGKTTILTTHYMEEAEKLSDRVCIVDQGRIVALDTPQELIHQLTQEREIHLKFENDAGTDEQFKEFVQSVPGISKVAFTDGNLQLHSSRPEESLYHLFRYTTEQQIQVEQISIKDLSLEDVFIAFTGKEWRD